MIPSLDISIISGNAAVLSRFSTVVAQKADKKLVRREAGSIVREMGRIHHDPQPECPHTISHFSRAISSARLMSHFRK